MLAQPMKYWRLLHRHHLDTQIKSAGPAQPCVSEKSCSMKTDAIELLHLPAAQIESAGLTQPCARNPQWKRSEHNCCIIDVSDAPDRERRPDTALCVVEEVRCGR